MRSLQLCGVLAVQDLKETYDQIRKYKRRYEKEEDLLLQLQTRVQEFLSIGSKSELEEMNDERLEKLTKKERKRRTAKLKSAIGEMRETWVRGEDANIDKMLDKYNLEDKARQQAFNICQRLMSFKKDQLEALSRHEELTTLCTTVRTNETLRQWNLEQISRLKMAVRYQKSIKELVARTKREKERYSGSWLLLAAVNKKFDDVLRRPHTQGDLAKIAMELDMLVDDEEGGKQSIFHLLREILESLIKIKAVKAQIHRIEALIDKVEQERPKKDTPTAEEPKKTKD
ncbi:hypothetical protein L596_001178 [Steinernema carpocapsae]|uniref:Uncharacterized protein n=1 Tax=Steinernema carpocapsae TaxID=34508 RepID=A0A4U8UMX5_STECR|nr:hypothetical protein L596_001178 [Steinernema carpocapsae]